MASQTHATKTSKITATAKPPERPFAIVAIGASAGGLEALEQFLGQVPADGGMAFVVIQHLDPDHKGMMPELLQRATAMPVAQARNLEAKLRALAGKTRVAT
jgi:two-component system CheB/CheR fusion protein